MKYILFFVIIIGGYAKAQKPLSTNALKAIINDKLAPYSNKQITAQQLQEITNSLADQIGLKANNTDLSNISASVSGRTAFQSIAALRASKLTTALAPGAVNITDYEQAGTFILDTVDKITPDNLGTVLRTASNLCYRRVMDGRGINVKWFGAKGDGLANDRPAIQYAIDWAKVQKTNNGGNVRINVIFPNGTYRLNGTNGINITNANGIWLSGGEGKYMTTQINGNCGGTIFDFTGSTMSGCSGFTFVSLKSETNPSATGVMFGLSQNSKGNQIGGLNCSIKDCYFQLDNNPKLNGGFGTIGILNIRSEEFKIDGCLIRANTGIVLSSSNIINTRSANFSFKSNYATIATNTGSMGVVDIVGTSIQNYEKVQHSLILNGTNGVNFSGYLYGGNGKIGNEDAAIGLYKSNLTLNLSGTIEGFSTIMYFGSEAKLYNSQVRYSYANIADITRPVIYMESKTLISHSAISIVFGNGTAEMGNRYFLYTPPIDGGNSPTTASIIQSNFNLPSWYDNTKVISAALLRQTTGICEFVTGQPFSVDSYWITDNKKYPKILGTLGDTNPHSIIRFQTADKVNQEVNNGGVYVIKIRGVVKIGNYDSKESCSVDFESTINITQVSNSKRVIAPAVTNIHNKSLTSQAYADITDISAEVLFEKNLGNIRLILNTKGNGKGEPIFFLGQVSIFSDFFVNSTPIFE